MGFNVGDKVIIKEKGITGVVIDILGYGDYLVMENDDPLREEVYFKRELMLYTKKEERRKDDFFEF